MDQRAYLDWTATSGESTVFGGFRIENRVRPLWREHWINPVLYFEFEDINEDSYSPGTRLTSQYLGPVANWQSPNGPRFSAGIGFGLNDYSLPRIYRVGVAYEVGQVGRLFHGKGGR